MIPELRSVEQNKRMWAMLGDISRQVEWPCDGQMKLLSTEDWKDIFTAGLLKHQRIAAGLEGGFVMLGQRTKSMPKAVMTELIELMFAFGAEKGVEWTDPTIVPLEAYA